MYVIKYPEVVSTTNIAESGRTSRDTFGPYVFSDFLDRTTTASIAVGYMMVSVWPYLEIEWAYLCLPDSQGGSCDDGKDMAGPR